MRRYTADEVLLSRSTRPIGGLSCFFMITTGGVPLKPPVDAVIGLASNNPEDVLNYAPCGHTTLSSDGSTVEVVCSRQYMPNFRPLYLIIHKLSPGSLAICEIEIMAQGNYIELPKWLGRRRPSKVGRS